MTLYLAWKKHPVGRAWIVSLLCACATMSCGQLRLPEAADAAPEPPADMPDATPALDAAPVSDAAVAVDAAPDVVIDAAPQIDAGPSCAEVDLGTGLGTPIFSGNTMGLPDDDASPECGGDFAGDIFFAWTAPATDRYRFDTCGSTFDTVLSAREDGCGTEIRCSDDTDVAPCELQSRFTLDLTEGERIILVVDGFEEGDEGPFVLNITRL